MEEIRYDIISDTHGYLSRELMHELEGADIIIHAGDCCSIEDYERLNSICRVIMCVGNNDWGLDYGPEVKSLTRAFLSEKRWEVCHYEERLDLATCDIAICGHTHRPFVRHEGNVLVMNPGSPTFPRTDAGPTMGRIIMRGPEVVKTELIPLVEPDAPKGRRVFLPHHWR